MISEIKALRHLLSMPRAELVSRANAWGEVQAAGRALIDACQAGGSVTSREVAALAGSVMALEPDTRKMIPGDQHNELLRTAKTLAGSCLEQYPGDEEAPDASTRSLADAQRHGQADPLVKTVAIGSGSTGPHGTDKEA